MKPTILLRFALLSAALAACHEEAPQDVLLDGAVPISADGGGEPTIFDDFPNGPITTRGVPADAPSHFAAPDGAGTAICVLEPTSGALVPPNFTPLYFEWGPAGGQIFELTLHVNNQSNDLVLFTTLTHFALSNIIWTALAQHSADHDVAYSIRSAPYDGTTIGSPGPSTSGTIHIAPATAEGAVVYWTTSNGSAFKGFRIGDATVTDVLNPTQLGDDTKCVGCHISAPDGTSVIFSRRNTPIGVPSPFSIDARVLDGSFKRPSGTDLSAAALTLLQRFDQTMPTASLAHFSKDEAIVIATLRPDSSSPSELVWTDLRNPSSSGGIVVREGDMFDAAEPSWSHDGMNIAYVSSPTVVDGRTESGATDIRVVPYNSRAGGMSAPLPGASDPNVQEYYPSYSSDDRLIAFNHVDGVMNTYDEPTSEVYVIPSAGGTALRLVANDPPTCAPYPSPGITNSWPRWAPTAKSVNGVRYHWIVFSSRRRGGPLGHPQLFVAAITQNEADQAVKTYPAVYVRTQPEDESNHTPAWDAFQLPIP